MFFTVLHLPVLEIDKINVTVEIGLFTFKIRHYAKYLHVLGEHGRWDEALNAEKLAFVDGERHAFEVSRIAQQLDTLDLRAWL